MSVASAEAQPSVWCRVLHIPPHCTCCLMLIGCTVPQLICPCGAGTNRKALPYRIWSTVLFLGPHSQLESFCPVAYRGQLRSIWWPLKWSSIVPFRPLVDVWSINIHCNEDNVLSKSTTEGQSLDFSCASAKKEPGVSLLTSVRLTGQSLSTELSSSLCNANKKKRSVMSSSYITLKQGYSSRSD